MRSAARCARRAGSSGWTWTTGYAWPARSWGWIELANATADAQARAAHCTFVVVGAGDAGVETAATLQAFTRHALRRFINLRVEHLRWILVDVAPHVLPELGDVLSGEAMRILRQRGIDVRPKTSVTDVTEDSVQLSGGECIGCRTLVWTAGVAANPLLATPGLQTGRSGRLVVTPTLQVPRYAEVFAAGDGAAVPDLTSPGEATTPPTHSTRSDRGSRSPATSFARYAANRRSPTATATSDWSSTSAGPGRSRAHSAVTSPGYRHRSSPRGYHLSADEARAFAEGLPTAAS